MTRPQQGQRKQRRERERERERERDHTCVAVGSGPATMTDFSAGHVAVIVTEAVVARSTELGAAGSVEVFVTNDAVAVLDSRKPQRCWTERITACPRVTATADAAAAAGVDQSLRCQAPDQRSSTSCVDSTCSQFITRSRFKTTYLLIISSCTVNFIRLNYDTLNLLLLLLKVTVFCFTKVNENKELPKERPFYRGPYNIMTASRRIYNNIYLCYGGRCCFGVLCFRSFMFL